MGGVGEMERLIGEYAMIPAGCTLLCAVSGGADSVYLLHRLSELRQRLDFRLIAAHYNHGLRGEEARRDEEFTREFAAKHCTPPVELVVGRGDVAAEAARRKTGPEDAARAMRYAFLYETARRVGAQRIATAHTADDNCETLLLHLLRGSGLQGLTGIRPVQGQLIRPMLTTPRAEVEDYLTLHGLPHVEDSTNETDDYLRNRLRHQVMPKLEELSPGFTRRSRDTMDYLRADQALLETQAEALWRDAVFSEGRLSLPAKTIADAPEPLAVRAVRQMLCRLRDGDDRVTAAHLLAVTALCRGDDPSARADLPGGLAAWREYGLLCMGERERPGGPIEPQPVRPPCTLTAGEWTVECAVGKWEPGNDGFLYFDCAMLKGGLWLRGRRIGDELTLPGGHRRTLKRILIDRKVPKAQREGIPVLADEEGILAAAGIGPDSRRLAGPGQQALKVRFIKKMNTVPQMGTETKSNE